MTPPIRVVLVDDHTLFRKGLAELLERDGIIKVVGITGSADEARRLLKEQKPDVAIMDLHMPSGDGVSLLKQLRQEGIDIPTLLLTVSDAEALAIVGKHCVMCHSVHPTHAGFDQPPKGVVFGSIEDLHAHATQILAQAVNSTAMPLGNETGITTEERQKLGAFLLNR